jgi:hypothetical protein
MLTLCKLFITDTLLLIELKAKKSPMVNRAFHGESLLIVMPKGLIGNRQNLMNILKFAYWI